MSSSQRRRLLILFAVGVLSACIYLKQTQSSMHSWWSLFHHTFVANVADFSSFDEAFQPATYRLVLQRELAASYSGSPKIQTNLPLFLLLSMLLLFCRGRGRLRLRLFAIAFQSNALITACLFPSVVNFDRLLAPLYLMVAIFTVIALGSERESLGSQPAGSQSGGSVFDP